MGGDRDEFGARVLPCVPRNFRWKTRALVTVTGICGKEFESFDLVKALYGAGLANGHANNSPTILGFEGKGLFEEVNEPFASSSS